MGRADRERREQGTLSLRLVGVLTKTKEDNPSTQDIKNDPEKAQTAGQRL